MPHITAIPCPPQSKPTCMHWRIALGLLLVARVPLAQLAGVNRLRGAGFSCTAALMVFGVPYEQALSVSIILHATFFVPGILAGSVFLWRESLSWRGLWVLHSQERDVCPDKNLRR